MPICDKNLSFKECEIELLRHAVDDAEKIQAKELVMTTEIKDLIDIVEDFLVKKKINLLWRYSN